MTPGKYIAKQELGKTTWGVLNTETNLFFETGYTQAYAEEYADDLNHHLETKHKDLVDWSY